MPRAALVLPHGTIDKNIGEIKKRIAGSKITDSDREDGATPLDPLTATPATKRKPIGVPLAPELLALIRAQLIATIQPRHLRFAVHRVVSGHALRIRVTQVPRQRRLDRLHSSR